MVSFSAPRRKPKSSTSVCYAAFGFVLGFILAALFFNNPSSSSECLQNAMLLRQQRQQQQQQQQQQQPPTGDDTSAIRLLLMDIKEILNTVDKKPSTKKLESSKNKHDKKHSKDKGGSVDNHHHENDDHHSLSENIAKLSNLVRSMQNHLDYSSTTPRDARRSTPPFEPPLESPEVLAEREHPKPPGNDQVRIALAVTPRPGERDFFRIGNQHDTDKVAAWHHMDDCLGGSNPREDSGDVVACIRPNCTRPECRVWGHFYHKIYQERLGPYSLDTAEAFQFLEIGFFEGDGYETFRDFLPNAEIHSMEISCLPEGPRDEGKWPWGNFAAKNDRWYSKLRREHRLHCGDANNVTWLNEVWEKRMHRKDAPPLKIVVDDGAHYALHMVQSVMFWFPRIAPGGLMIVEDIQPIADSTLFRTQFLPQLMADLHYCGDTNDSVCLPTLQPLLQSIHCEMHICFLERNQAPAQPHFDLKLSTAHKDNFDLKSCRVLKDKWGNIVDDERWDADGRFVQPRVHGDHK